MIIQVPRGYYGCGADITGTPLLACQRDPVTDGPIMSQVRAEINLS